MDTSRLRREVRSLGSICIKSLRTMHTAFLGISLLGQVLKCQRIQNSVHSLNVPKGNKSWHLLLICRTLVPNRRSRVQPGNDSRYFWCHNRVWGSSCHLVHRDLDAAQRTQNYTLLTLNCQVPGLPNPAAHHMTSCNLQIMLLRNISYGKTPTKQKTKKTKNKTT